jgi:ribosomal protein L15
LHGFHSHKLSAEIIYTGQLDQFAGKTVDSFVLAEAGLISNAFVTVKLLSKGDVTKKATVKLPAASASAVVQVEKAGGSFEQIPRASRPQSTKKTERRAAKAKTA